MELCKTKTDILKKTIRAYQKKVSTKNSQLLKLKKRYKDKLKKLRTYELTYSSIQNNILFKIQMRLKRFKKLGRRYKENEKCFALAFYYNSPKAYNFMNKYLCLPTVRSLRRWLQMLDVSCGINDNILQILEKKFESQPKSEKVISIVFDEMSLKQLVSYNSQNDTLYGFEDYGPEIDLKTTKKCNQALVIMIKGIKSSWKQVIGYYFSCGATAGAQLKSVLINAIFKLKSIGLIPKIVVCDQGTNNQQLRKILGVTSDFPFITHDEDTIYFMYDTPHLLKSVRNNLKKYNLIYEEKCYSWDDIVQFYNLDKNKSPRLAPKIKDTHIQLPPFSPMRVCLASQILSHSVSSGMMTLIAHNLLPPKAINTANFIQLMDNLFDTFNSISFNESKVYRKPLSENSCHWELLNEARKVLTKIHVQNRTGKQPLCITGWIANISCLKYLFEDLKLNFGFEFILCRNLTQDCIESWFSVVRAKGGNNSTPDSTKFFSAVRMCMANQLLDPSKAANCEMDNNQFLTKCNELLKHNPKLDLKLQHLKSSQKWNPEDDDVLSDMNITFITQNSHEENAIAYVAGWSVSKLNHTECLQKLATKEPEVNLAYIHISMKQYDGAKLLYPLQPTLVYVQKVICLFNNNIKKLISCSRANIKLRMINLINTFLFKTLDICLECQYLLVDKILNVTINSFIKKENNYYRDVQNKKLKKIVHM